MYKRQLLGHLAPIILTKQLLVLIGIDFYHKLLDILTLISTLEFMRNSFFLRFLTQFIDVVHFEVLVGGGKDYALYLPTLSLRLLVSFLREMTDLAPLSPFML